MNRYTQLTASEFTPLSLQELSIAPAYMRGKHDEAVAAQEAIKSQMLASGDVLDQHRDEFSQYENELNNMMSQEAENLAKYGYNKNSSSNLTRLNRYYNTLMAPTGRMGQMIAAKKDYAEKYKSFIENATKDQKIGLDIAQRGWSGHAKGYTGYDGSGGISNIEQLGAPEKREVVDAVNERTKDLGTVQQVLSKNSGYNLVQNPDGSLTVVNGKGEKVVDSNLQNALMALNGVVAEFSTPGQRGYEYSSFAELNPMSVANEIYSLMMSKIKIKETDDRNSSASVVGYKNPNDNDDSAGNYSIVGGDRIERPVSTNFEITSQSALNGEIARLEGKVNNGTATSEEIEELNNLTFAKDEIEEYYKNLPAGTKKIIADEEANSKRKAEKEYNDILKNNGIENFNPDLFKFKFKDSILKDASAGPIIGPIQYGLKKMLYNDDEKILDYKIIDDANIKATYNGVEISAKDARKIKAFNSGDYSKYDSKELKSIYKQIPKTFVNSKEYQYSNPTNNKTRINQKSDYEGVRHQMSTNNFKNMPGDTRVITPDGQNISIKSNEYSDVTNSSELDALMKTGNNLFIQQSVGTGSRDKDSSVLISLTVPYREKPFVINGTTLKQGETVKFQINAANKKDTSRFLNIAGNAINIADKNNSTFPSNPVETFQYIGLDGKPVKDYSYDESISYDSNYSNLIKTKQDYDNLMSSDIINIPGSLRGTEDPYITTIFKNMVPEFLDYMKNNHNGVGKVKLELLSKSLGKSGSNKMVDSLIYRDPNIRKYFKEFSTGKKTSNYVIDGK